MCETAARTEADRTALGIGVAVAKAAFTNDDVAGLIAGDGLPRAAAQA